MSHLFDEYLLRCFEEYNPCEPDGQKVCNIDDLCSAKCRDIKSCKDCLSDIFNNSAHRMREYNCIPITYSYVIRYTNQHASEIYHILNGNEDLLNAIDGKYITSIGCGPATELIGIEKLLRDMNINIHCKYFGFDTNPIWATCHYNIVSVFSDNKCRIKINFENSELHKDNPILKNTKLLILNYVVSHVYKHSEECATGTTGFLSSLNPIIHQIPQFSSILINDTNSRNMGRDQIEKWGDELSAQFRDMTLEKGYFDYPNRDQYIKFKSGSHKMRTNDFIFNNCSRFYRFTENVNECRSAFLLITKE